LGKTPDVLVFLAKQSAQHLLSLISPPHGLITRTGSIPATVSQIFRTMSKLLFLSNSLTKVSQTEFLIDYLARAVLRKGHRAATAYALDIPANDLRHQRAGSQAWQNLLAEIATSDFVILLAPVSATRETEPAVTLLRLLPACAFGHASLQIVVTGNVPVHRRMLLEELINEIRPLQPQVVFPALQIRAGDLLAIERHRVSLKPVVRTELDQALTLWQRRLDPVLLPAIEVNGHEVAAVPEEAVLKAG
jgi:NAD(P)H-dependent FMN reductase